MSIEAEFLTFEQLGLMTEDELEKRNRFCRNRADRSRTDSLRILWESAGAFTQRELGLRQSRRSQHERYVQRLHEEDLAESYRERQLPEYEGNRIPQYVRDILAERLGSNWDLNLRYEMDVQSRHYQRQ